MDGLLENTLTLMKEAAGLPSPPSTPEIKAQSLPPPHHPLVSLQRVLLLKHQLIRAEEVVCCLSEGFKTRLPLGSVQIRYQF